MNKQGKREKRTSRYIFFGVSGALALLAAFVLIAQPMLADAKGRFGRPGSADEIMQTLVDRLGLTPEQVEAVRPIIEEKLIQQNEIRQRTDTDRKARRAEMRKLRWDTEIRLSEILTDEQVDRYLELRQEQRKEFKRGKHRDGWMGKGMHRSPERVVERLRDRLNLSDEQTIKAEPVIKEGIEKKRAIVEKYREEGFKVKKAMRGEMQAIEDETHAKLAPILNDTQKEKLDAMKEQKRELKHRWMDRHGAAAY